MSKSQAIIIACLSSFRSLFHQQASRIHSPRQVSPHESKNVFLRGGRPEGKIKGSVYDSLMELSRLGATTTGHERMTDSDNTSRENRRDIESIGKASTDRMIVPPQSVFLGTDPGVES